MSLSDSLTVDLSDYRWKNRLLLFGPSTEEARQAFMAQQADARERDLLMFYFESAKRAYLNGQAIQSDDARAIWKKQKLDSGVIVLIGKDGGVKLRKTTPITTREIFGLIDSMPMRMQERKSRLNPD